MGLAFFLSSREAEREAQREAVFELTAMYEYLVNI